MINGMVEQGVDLRGDHVSPPSALTEADRVQSGRRGRRRCCGVVLAAVASVLAACGGSSGDGGSATSTSALLGPTATPATTRISPWRVQEAKESCIGRPGTVIRVAGDQGQERLTQRNLDARVTVDARQASWSGEVNYPVVLDGGRGLCVSGGQLVGTWKPSTSWEDMHSVGGMRVSNRESTIEGVRIHDYGDAIRFVKGAEGFRVRRAYLSYIRDDCIENDWAYSGVVEDSFLDGCYNAFSARGYDSQDRSRDGSADLVTIRNTLVRLQPMEGVYKNRGLIPGHAGFFKWDDAAPRLELHGNVFRADQDANTVGLDLPLEKLGPCSGNIMVWLGAGPYPHPLPSSCFTLTTDRSVWERAAAAWKAAHGHR
jgi:hypothetical protein